MQNLLDVTFLIPLRIDTDDRLINAQICLDYLTSNFNTNIILLEDSNKSRWNDYKPINNQCIRYIFIRNNNKSFNRMVLLNKMLALATTDVIVNYDIDILLPIKSYMVGYNYIKEKWFDYKQPFSNDGQNIWAKSIVELYNTGQRIRCLHSWQRHLDLYLLYLQYALEVAIIDPNVKADELKIMRDKIVQVGESRVPEANTERATPALAWSFLEKWGCCYRPPLKLPPKYLGHHRKLCEIPKFSETWECLSGAGAGEGCCCPYIPLGGISMPTDISSGVYFIPQALKNLLKKDKNISCLKDIKLNRSLAVWGYAIFLNRESYIEAGGENSHLLGSAQGDGEWNADDKERFIRFKKLNYLLKNNFNYGKFTTESSDYPDYNEDLYIQYELYKIPDQNLVKSIFFNIGMTGFNPDFSEIYHMNHAERASDTTCNKHELTNSHNNRVFDMIYNFSDEEYNNYYIAKSLSFYTKNLDGFVTNFMIGSHGQLGNQLFQYAVLYAISKKLDLPIYIPKIKSNSKLYNLYIDEIFDINSITLDKFFNYKFHKNLESNDFNDEQIRIINDDLFRKKNIVLGNELFYDKNVVSDDNIRKVKEIESISNKENKQDTTVYFYKESNIIMFQEDIFDKLKSQKKINLEGYYQSYKYFEEYKDDLQTKFYNTSYTRTALDILNEIKQKNNVNELCSFHIRRGDNVYGQHREDIGFPAGNQPTILKIIEMVDLIRSKHKGILVLFFSDEIEWCKEHITLDNIAFSEGNSHILDLYMMSLCDHNIIATSTFSWWGAYLNQNKNKDVYYPLPWFNPNIPSLNKINTNDLFPPKWIKYNIV